MQERLQELAKKSGKSFDEVHAMWEFAKKDASRKKLKLGSQQHTQHAFQKLDLLVNEAMKQAESEKSSNKKSKNEK
jgi:hypothetical protein